MHDNRSWHHWIGALAMLGLGLGMLLAGGCATSDPFWAWVDNEVIPAIEQDLAATSATTTTTTTQEPAESAEAEIHWTGTLTANRGVEGAMHWVRVGRKVEFDYDVPFSHGSLCYFVERDGNWIGGRVDNLRPTEGKPTQKVKLRHNFDSGYLGKFGEGRDKMKPRSGETVKWCIASRKSKTRTPLIESVWP